MNRYLLNILSTIFIFSIFISCKGDCIDEQIEKVEWKTDYITKTKDTLVSYLVLDNSREYLINYRQVYHKITIKNTNEIYTNKFAVKIYYGNHSDYYGDEMNNNDYEYVEIKPKSSYSFTFYSQAQYSHNFNNFYTILQEPTTIKYIQRVDNLNKKIITVNSCSENVEALKEKYKTIKELYHQKLKNTNIYNGQK